MRLAIDVIFTNHRVGGTYRPHLVPDGSNGTLLGVEFSERRDYPAGESTRAEVKAYYPGVDYSALRPGTKFDVVEGATVVGRGTVLGELPA